LEKGSLFMRKAIGFAILLSGLVVIVVDFIRPAAFVN
jgi:hypothetical protein